MANEEKKTPSDAKTEQKTGPKKLVVTWFKSENALTHYGLEQMNSYERGNRQMRGSYEFTWIPGSNFIETPLPGNKMAIIPIYGLMFTVQL